MHKTIVPPRGSKHHIITERLGGGNVRTACGKEQWNMFASKTTNHNHYMFTDSYSSHNQLCETCIEGIMDRNETAEDF